MLKLLNETLITAQQVVELPIFSGRKRPPTTTTILNWMRTGTSEGVRLESVKIGRTHYTSREAVFRFITALNPLPEERVQLTAEAMIDDDQ